MKITCHMIMSVDGRLLPKYWSPLYNASSLSLIHISEPTRRS